MNSIKKVVAPFDKVDLLGKIAALQLIPHNARFYLRLEAIACAVATGENRHGLPLITRKRLSQICNSDELAKSQIGMAEDPPEQLFSENLTCEGGSYIVFPGVVEDATYIIRQLAKAIFLNHDHAFSPEFIHDVRLLMAPILQISDLIATRAGIKRNIAPIDAPDRKVDVPSFKDLNACQNAVTFNSHYLDNLVILGRSLLDLLHPYILETGIYDLREYDISNSPLHITPIIKCDDSLIVSEPGSLLGALRHQLVLSAFRHGLNEELQRQFRRAAWDGVFQSFDHLGIGNIYPDLASFESDCPCIDGLFSFDTDKALYVQLITDDLRDYPQDNAFGFVDLERHSEKLVEARNKVQDQLFMGKNPPNELMSMTLIQTLGRGIAISFPRDVSEDPLWPPFSASDLETISLAEGGDQLVLYKYAKAHLKIHEKRDIFSPDQLDEFQLYRRYHYSYYISDNNSSSPVAIFPGYSGEIRKEVSKARDIHGVPAFKAGHVVEVTCRYSCEIPIYLPINDIGARVTNLIEIEGSYVWVIGPDYSRTPGSSDLHIRYVGFADTISFWLWKCSKWLKHCFIDIPSMQPIIIQLELSPIDDWKAISEELAGTPTSSIESYINVDSSTQEPTLRLTLSPGLIGFMTGRDNSGEREMMRVVLSSLGKLALSFTNAASPPFSSNQIEAVLNEYIPLGTMKMTTVTFRNTQPQLDQTDIPPFRTIKASDTQAIQDELGEHIVAQGWQEGPIEKDKRLPFLNDEVVSFLYRSLQSMISTLRFEELLSRLVYLNESIIAHLFESRLIIPTRLACFFNSIDFQNTLKKEIPELNQASSAVRFLIEYTTSVPPRGIRPMSLEMQDRLMGLSSEIVSWGFDSDIVKYAISNLELSLLPSGRVGTNKDDFLKARDLFLTEFTLDEINKAHSAFIRSTRKEVFSQLSAPPADIVDEISSLDKASLCEFGFTFTELAKFVGDIYSIACDRDVSVIKMPLSELIQSLSVTLQWPKEKVTRGIELFSLKQRDDYLKPPSPFAQYDVYPWRFNRGLSYIRRPLLRFISPDGEQVIWGKRHVYHSLAYLFDLIMTGKLFASTIEMRQLLGKLNEERGKDFNNSVSDLLTTIPDIIINPRLTSVGKQSIRGPKGDLGDIDVFVVDPSNKIMFSIECKDLTLSRTPYELKSELDNIFLGMNGSKSVIEKHLLRTQWLREHLNDLIYEFDVNKQGPWRVEPLLVVDEGMYSAHLYKSAITVITYRKLAEEVLPLRNKTGTWKFT